MGLGGRWQFSPQLYGLRADKAVNFTMNIYDLTIDDFRISRVRSWGTEVLKQAKQLELEPDEQDVIKSLEAAIANPSAVNPLGEYAFRVTFAGYYRQVLEKDGADNLRIEKQRFVTSLNIFRGSALEVLGSEYRSSGLPAPTHSNLSQDDLYRFYPDIKAPARRHQARAKRLHEQISNQHIRIHLERLIESLNIIPHMALHNPTRARQELLRTELHLEEITRERLRDLGERAKETREKIDQAVKDDWFEGDRDTLKQLSALIGDKLALNDHDDELEWFVVMANILFSEGLPRPSLQGLKATWRDEKESTANTLAELKDLALLYLNHIKKVLSSAYPVKVPSLKDLAETISRVRDIISYDEQDTPTDREALAQREREFEEIFDTAVTVSWMQFARGNEPEALSGIYSFEPNPLYANAVFLAAGWRHVLDVWHPIYRETVRPAILNAITSKDFVTAATDIQSGKDEPLALALPNISRFRSTTMHLEVAGGDAPYLLKLAQRMSVALTMPERSSITWSQSLSEREWAVSMLASVIGNYLPLRGHPGEVALFAADEPFAEEAELVSPLPYILPFMLLSAILAVRPGGVIQIAYKRGDDKSIAADIAKAMGCSCKSRWRNQQIIKVPDFREGSDDRPKGPGSGPKPRPPKGKGSKKARKTSLGSFDRQMNLLPPSATKSLPVSSNLRRRRRRGQSPHKGIGTGTTPPVGTPPIRGAGAPNLITIMKTPIIR